MKKSLLSVASAVCMLGAVAAQAAPTACYVGYDVRDSNKEFPTYLTLSMKRDGRLTPPREYKDINYNPIQLLYSVLGRAAGESGNQVLPVYGSIIEAKNTGVKMVLSTFGTQYSCEPTDLTEVSITPTAWTCSFAILSGTGGSRVFHFDLADPWEEDCIHYIQQPVLQP